MFEKLTPNNAALVKSHFANLFQLAMADAIINKQEADYLEGLCKQYNISKEEYNYILDNAYTIDLVVPDTPLARLEQIYELVRMVLMDELIDERKVQLCVKVAKNLGFGAHVVGDLIKALVTISDDSEQDEFSEEDLKLILKED